MSIELGITGSGADATEAGYGSADGGGARLPGASAGPAHATLRCYAELNAHLPERWRHRDVPLGFTPPVTVAQLLAALGIPPADVELILVDGASAGLDAPVADGARLSLYPVFERFDVAPLLRLRDTPLRTPRFLCDTHLGKLGRRLRLLGFDTLLAQDASGEDPGDDALVRLASEQHRILLTRDRALLARPSLTHALAVPQAPVDAQLRDLIERLHLQRAAEPFTRCTCCNTLVEPADPAELPALPPGVLARQDRFWRCPGCGRVYWEGSHHRRLRGLVDDLLQ
ncbi:MAG: Mut7-C ubiquitin/RNAse domain-containing protein [Thiohalocapsa sp.]|uniref:Mut7-C RNAse domain-containing protein n=1 Tax=Thiohalocapsa sp. TaxID=2497641 RepID=UPI0025F581F3|nr:Mut7-C RNAse domain-containing protein [Thiohalocapsa sp.]MCG6943692.1 Mut7-C ubiquitin/RNAse domain-containing protein [Thiohalocapsa sp.]